MRLSVKTTAMAILVSLGVTADFGKSEVSGAITNITSGEKDISLEKGTMTLDTYGVENVRFDGKASPIVDGDFIYERRYQGAFAGPNAEEVIGTVSGSNQSFSFGGKRQ